MKSKNALRVAIAGALAAGIAALYPLYGDPRVSAVSHPEWARMMLRGLELDTPGTGKASVAFAALSWHTSLAFKGDEYERADALQVIAEPPDAVRAESVVGTAAYPVTVVRAGDYSVRVRMMGRPDAPASAELASRGATSPLATFTFRPTAQLGWIEGGRVHLDAGSYLASVLLPSGTAMDRLEVVPPCVTSIEPPQGWQTPKIASTTDVAVTILKAVDKESELAPAGSSIELPGSAIQRYMPALMSVAAGGSFAGGTSGVEGLLTVDVPEAGLYTVYVQGEIGGGQRWLADGCRKQLLCGASRPTKAQDQWFPVMTSDLSAGHHAVSVRLGPNATAERIRVERKRTDGDAYLESLRKLGLDIGPEGPISRSKAVDAMEWLKRENRHSLGATCADLAAPKTEVPTQKVVDIQQPGQTPGPSGEPPTVPGVSPFVPIPEVPSPVQ